MALFAVASACTSESPQAGEPDAPERAAVASALLDELSVEGALLDDTPQLQVLQAITPARSAAGMARISVPIASAAWPFSRPLDKLLRSWGAAVPSSCATVEQTSPDADGDGIPPVAIVLFNCTSPAVSGTGFVIDDNDADPQSGFAVGVRDLRVRTQSNGDQSAGDQSAGGTLTTRTVNASFIASVRDAPAPGAFDVKIDLRVATERSLAGGATTVLGIAWAGTTTLYPDPDLAVSARLQRGSVTSSARTSITYAGTTRTWSRRAAPSLRWSAGCKAGGAVRPGFDGGAAVYADDRGNSMQIAFTSCSEWTTTLNGHAL